MNAQFINFLNLLRKELGESIVEQRRKKRIKQWELALMCGISERMLRLIENGEQCFSLDSYLLIAIALDLPIEVLLIEAIAKLRAVEESRERLQRLQRKVRQCMQLRLEAHRKSIARTAGAGRQNDGSQDAETKAKYRSKGLARGGRCAKI